MDIKRVFFKTSDFELQGQKLGEGIYGTVYIAENKNDHELYAIKIIKTHDDFDGYMQMLLMRESLILYQLKHPGIIKFKGVNFQSFDDPTKLEPSIIMEYLKYGSLKKILDQEKLSLSVINWTSTKKYIMLLGISDAMRYLHKNGIIHRDLKPENILVDENSYPRICDFGFSKCFSKSLTNSVELTMSGQFGTPLYMAPELFDDGDHYTSSVDVYAFSMLAYEIVTCKEPFYELVGITPYTLAIKVLNGYRPIIPDFVPEKMKQLLSQCWSGNVDERPSFEEIFNKLSSDFSYFDESIEDDEVREYLEMIKEETVDIYKEEKSVNNEKIDELKKIVENYSSSNEQFSHVLSRIYQNPKEIIPDEIVKFLNESIEKGNSCSAFFLGLLYQKGEVVRKSYTKAIDFYQKAAEQNNSEALVTLGNLYEKGKCVEKDYTKAVDCYQKAAELNNSKAFVNLGHLYEKGKGVEKDYDKAADCFQKGGDSNSLNRLGSLYEDGEDQDFEKALEYYQKSAKLGNGHAFNNIGQLYEDGLGVEQNDEKAFEYYQKGSELNDSRAMCNLGRFYENGIHVEKDYNKANECYTNAIKHGNKEASENLKMFEYKKRLGNY